MISIACSGFPIPASRYFQEFRALEIANTELGLPGSGTVRRWLREATPQFAFSVVAPKQIAAAGFALDPGTQQALAGLAGFAKQLKSHAVIFAASDDWKPTRPHRARLRAFAEQAAKQLERPVFDLPAWSRKEAASALKDLPVYIAFDPLGDAPDPAAAFAYARMAGPSGYRSRYDNAALDRVVELCREDAVKHLFVAFRNIDRYENSKYVLSRLTT